MFILNLGEKSSSKKELIFSGAMYFLPFSFGFPRRRRNCSLFTSTSCLWIIFLRRTAIIGHFFAPGGTSMIGSKNRYSHLCKPDFLVWQSKVKHHLDNICCITDFDNISFAFFRIGHWARFVPKTTKIKLEAQGWRIEHVRICSQLATTMCGFDVGLPGSC